MRVLLYSHDSYGLGHVRRTIAVARRLVADLDSPSALVLTGSPRSHYFSYPTHCDYVKLPSVTKGEDGRYVSREIDLPLAETVELRSRLILESVSTFRPRVLIADHTPTGLGGEIVPALERLGRGPCRALRIFGMRDIIDEPEAVRRGWEHDGALDILDRCYEMILVYGQRDLFDPVERYALPARIARKVVFTGYISGVTGAMPADDDTRERFAPESGRLVVVTVGGGGDGDVLIRSILKGFEAHAARPPFDLVLVTGPLMSPHKREKMRGWSARLRGVRVLEYCSDLPALYTAADFVVAMGGYNTICELAAAGAKALIVPRVFPRQEQWLRARLLESRGMVRVLRPREATPDVLMREVLEGLDRPAPPPGWGLDLTGLSNLSRTVTSVTDLSSIRVEPPPSGNARPQ